MNTEIIYAPNLLEKLSKKTIVVDTCILIEASKNAEFATLLRDLHKAGSTFISVIPVRNEFLACAGEADEYKELEEFLGTLNVNFLSPNVEHRLEEKGCKFSVAMRRCKVKNPSYVDRLLFAIPYLYKSSPEQLLVMTSNHKDVPFEFYDRVGFLVWDKGNNFAEIGIYDFNKSKFNKISPEL